MTSRSTRFILSLPLARPARHGVNHAPLPSPASLTFYYFNINGKAKSLQVLPNNAREAFSSLWHTPTASLRWVQQKASDTWADWGKAEQSSWKFKVHKAGERIADRIEFEELTLKTIEPPSETYTQDQPSSDQKNAIGTIRIPLFYPPSLQTAEASLSDLRNMLDFRIPTHRKGFWVWMIIAPFTAPFMLIPIIPNLPFFFCVWRSWSHYKAYRGSEYVLKLLNGGSIASESSDVLDQLYKDYKPTEGSSTSSGSPQLLLSNDSIPALRSAFSLPSVAETELHRAIEQVNTRLSKQQK